MHTVIPAHNAALKRQDQPPMDVRSMFNRIATTYDLVNRVISLGQGLGWRRQVASRLADDSDTRLLDLATGTGDQIIVCFQIGVDISTAVGLDLSEGMLDIAREKIKRAGIEGRVSWKQGDACAHHFHDASFDAATMSFGLRNVSDIEATLRAIHRLLVLELSVPPATLAHLLYTVYGRDVMPLLAGAIPGDVAAYRYLNASVERFPTPQAVCAMTRSVGFVDVAA